MPVELETEHLPTQGQVWAQRRARDVLEDVGQADEVEYVPRWRDEVGILVGETGSAVRHHAEPLAWERSMDGVELAPVLSEEVDGVGLDELERVVPLRRVVDADDAPPGAV